MTGGEALARMFEAHGVGPMFGMGGFQLLPFYDAVRRMGLAHTLINDERCGVFAADAYARVSGRVGVCDATLGPGATNLVTGLVESLNAGVPLVVLVGDSHRLHSWKNMTQESRQIEILRPACKELIRVEYVERIPELVRRAFQVATSGRPGPVVLDVPEDVAHATYPFEDEFAAAEARAPALRPRPARDDLERAAELLAGAQRPLILAGGGVHLSAAADALQAFAERHNIPVAHTMSGKGAVACTSPLNAGLFGRYDRIANGLDVLSGVIGDLDAELFFERHHQFHCVKAVSAEIVDERRILSHFVLFHAQVFYNDLFHAVCDVAHNKSSCLRAIQAPFGFRPPMISVWRMPQKGRLFSLFAQGGGGNQAPFVSILRPL